MSQYTWRQGLIYEGFYILPFIVLIFLSSIPSSVFSHCWLASVSLVSQWGRVIAKIGYSLWKLGVNTSHFSEWNMGELHYTKN